MKISPKPDSFFNEILDVFVSWDFWNDDTHLVIYK